MKLSELIEELEDIQARLDVEDPDVMIASQPNYPLAHYLRGVVKLEIDDDEWEADTPAEEKKPGRDESVVWLVEGSGARPDPYAPKRCWDEL